MSDIVRKYGGIVGSLSREHPIAARRMLLAGFKMFGLKLRLKPDGKLPESRQRLAVSMNSLVTGVLAHPERAAITSVFMPCELIYAAGLVPMCAELYSSFVGGAHAEGTFADAAESEGISESFCSYHKVMLGSACLNVLPRPKCIVNTSLLCDANQLTFRELNNITGAPWFYLDVPPVPGEDAVQFVADGLRRCRAFLEDVTGREISDEAIRARLALSRDTVSMLRRSAELKQTRFIRGDIASELYEIYMAHNGLGSETALDYASGLVRDLEESGAEVSKLKVGRPVRLLWIHTIPNYQEPLRELINGSDELQLISCDMNTAHLDIECDPSRPYESMARRLVYNVFNGSGERRVEEAVKRAKKSGADGAVIFCHWGCKQTLGIASRMKEALEAEGTPALILDGDGCDERNASDGQVKTRMGAFMEMLRG